MWITTFLTIWTFIFSCKSQEVTNFDAPTVTETSQSNQGVEWDPTGPSVTLSIKDGRSGNTNRPRNELSDYPLFYSNQWKPLLMPIGFNNYNPEDGRNVDQRLNYPFLPTLLRRPDSDLNRNSSSLSAQYFNSFQNPFPPVPLNQINPMLFYPNFPSFTSRENSYATDSSSNLKNSSDPSTGPVVSNLKASSSKDVIGDVLSPRIPMNSHVLENLPANFYPSRENLLPPVAPIFAPPYPILPNRNLNALQTAVFPFGNSHLFDREVGSDVKESIPEGGGISEIGTSLTTGENREFEAIAASGALSGSPPTFVPPEPLPLPVADFPFGLIPPAVFPPIIPNPVTASGLPEPLNVPKETKLSDETVQQPPIPANLPLDSLPEILPPVNTLEPEVDLAETVEANVGGSVPVEKPSEAKIPYEFGFDMNDGQGTDQHRKEVSDISGTVRGSYGYRDMFGVYRLVNYIADKNGFRAFIQSNEPGVASSGSADVIVMAEKPPLEAIAESEKATEPEAVLIQDTVTDLLAEGSKSEATLANKK